MKRKDEDGVAQLFTAVTLNARLWTGEVLIEGAVFGGLVAVAESRRQLTAVVVLATVQSKRVKKIKVMACRCVAARTVAVKQVRSLRKGTQRRKINMVAGPRRPTAAPVVLAEEYAEQVRKTRKVLRESITVQTAVLVQAKMLISVVADEDDEAGCERA